MRRKTRQARTSATTQSTVTVAEAVPPTVEAAAMTTAAVEAVPPTVPQGSDDRGAEIN